MARFSVTIDEKLMEEARVLAHARTKQEAVTRALEEFVRRRRIAELTELDGADLVDLDLKELRRWRQAASTES